MTRFDILTLFPEMISPVLDSSMLARARKNGVLDFHVYNLRDYSQDKHGRADDYPFGGGAGMVMMAQPIIDCLVDVERDAPRGKRIFLSPRGTPLTPELAKSLAKEERITLLCGHYEGVDERAAQVFEDCVSIGDYVLTGGELPALVLIDCVSRLIPGVLGSEASAAEESFAGSLLEYPQYTRPSDFRGQKAPDVLLSGNHKEIEKWRREQSLRVTQKHRPDLLESAELSLADQRVLQGFTQPKAHIRLRPWRMEDAGEVAFYANNAAIAANLRDGFPHPYTMKDALGFIRTAMAETKNCFFAVDLEGKAIGSIGAFFQTDVYRDNAEIGYWLAEPYWGHGYMSEAIRLLTAHLMRSSDVYRLYAEPFARNKASCRALEKAGFVREALLKGNVIKNGIREDTCIYALLRPDYSG